MKKKWTILENWLVENKQRIIIKTDGAQLFDITAGPEIVNEIIAKVLNNSWTVGEFKLYLKEKGLIA